MNSQLKRRIRSCVALSTAVILGISSLSVYADESIESLQDKTSSLQNELTGLQAELAAISNDMNAIITQMENVTAQVEQSKLDLALAKADEEQRYEDMKIRIRYMYEEGQMTMLDILFSSVSMADFLNKADFIRNVSEYDREMLDKLIQIREEIEVKEAQLQQEQASLTQLKAELEVKQQELTSKINSASGELSAYTAQLEKAIAAAKAAEEALQKEAALPPAEEIPQTPDSQPNPSQSPDTGNSPAPENPGTEQPSQPDNKPSPSQPTDASDIDLFAAILQCEAGTRDYDALLAVATVIMNRMESPRYPNTLKGVIYQSGQFSPTWTGKLDKVLQKGAASLCYQVARDALGGARYDAVIDCYQFRAVGTSHQGVTVGGNVFF